MEAIMSKKMYWKPSVDDIQNNGCDEHEVEMLCDIFERRMQEMASTLLRKGWYHLEDFSDAQTRGIAEFTLTMEKYPHADAEQWIGIFEAEGKKLRLFGMLDPQD
jgi:hypothetical protein